MYNKIDNELKYTYEHVKRFACLELLNNVNRNKSIILTFTVCIIFIVALFQGFSNYDIKNFKQAFIYSNIKVSCLIQYILIGMLITHFISFYLHNKAYKHIIKFRSKNNDVNDYSKKSNKDTHKGIIIFLLIILSPDLFYADFYKSKLLNSVDKRSVFNEKNKYYDKRFYKTTLQWSLIRIERKSFIEYSNWLNIICTCLLIIFCMLLEYPLFDIYCKQIVLTILVVRLISRAFEIAFAFYKDVVQVNSRMFHLEKGEQGSIYYNGFNSSLIRQNGRLSLAIHSLVEMILLFAVIYYLFFMILAAINSETISYPTLFETLMISTSLGVFNISFDFYQNILLAFLHTSQLLISCILILLSIAQYLGADRTLSINEQILYREFSLLKQTYHDLQLKEKCSSKNTSPLILKIIEQVNNYIKSFFYKTRLKIFNKSFNEYLNEYKTKDSKSIIEK